MLSTSASVGCSVKKLALNSQASVMKVSPEPACTLPPIRSISPPMWMEGSRPASSSTVDSIEVEVVLPCVPQMATERG